MRDSAIPPAVSPISGSGGAKPQVGLVLTAVLLVYVGQMTLNPIIAPLAREVGLAEWQVGVMISVAALCIVLSSRFWGRKSLSWGRKPVLVGAMATAAGAMVLFAVLARLGMNGILSGIALFILFILARGVLFGLAIAAVGPTAQAYIADVTETEEARVKGMAGVGAVQGIAIIVGSVAGGLLAGLGLMVPLIFVPIMLILGTLTLAIFLRRESRHELIADPPSVSPWDPRVWPFLVAGFGMFTALGFIQVIAGFIVQDRFHLTTRETAVITAGALLASGIGMVLAQAVIVPRTRWLPPRLLRVGAFVAMLGFIVMAPDLGLPVFIGGMFLMGLGLGIAMPGYIAGPTLLMNKEEQGAMAGLAGANNALTFVLAPTIGTSLYALWPPLPIIVSAGMMAVVVVFLWVHPRFRSLTALAAAAALDETANSAA